MSKFLPRLIFLVCLFCLSCSNSQKALSPAEKFWKTLPIQQGGRIKPFDTFSRETLRAVYGRESYKKRSAVEAILSWLILPDFWDKTKFILVEKEIKKSLGLPLKSKHFSPEELARQNKLALQLTELQSLRQRSERLDPYFQKLAKLETRLILYSAVKTGQLIRLEPQKQRWHSLPELSKPAEDRFKKLLSLYIRLISLSTSSGAKDLPPEEGFDLKKDKNVLSSDHLKKGQTKAKEIQSLLESFRERGEEFKKFLFKGEINQRKIQVEAFYNSFKPFQKAWIFYLLFLTALIFVFKRGDRLKWIIPFVGVGFIFHSLGLMARSYIMSRPPVSNMYETVVWVPWAALLAGFVFYLRGSKMPFIAGAILSFFCLWLTSLAPDILSSRLEPLEAVLNSNFWLATHVLIITMSYSFFFLAFVLGDMALIFYLVNKTQPLSFVNKMSQPIYRLIQWGALFLAGGTILGGIWADYSWGRFWGWDPKESWALVSLLAYLALLHGKLVSWIRPFGLAVGAVLMFFLVIMAWYGVNFILGAGLHSYGFGSGGVEYVAGFLFLHLILCGLAFYKKIKAP